MPVITFTQGDILRGKLLDPGWYTFKITKIEQATAKAGGSINTIITFQLENHSAAGKEIQLYFNSKAKSGIIPVFAAITGPVEPGSSYDTDDLLQKSLDCKVIHDTYEGNLKNDIAEFLPAGKGVGQTPAF